MSKYDIRTSLKPSGLQTFIGSTTSRDDGNLKQLSLAQGYLQITTGFSHKFTWDQGAWMIVSSEKLVCSFWVYVRSYERINYEKQNEIYLKLSSDLHWETKFARLRKAEESARLVWNQSRQKKSCHILRENYTCERQLYWFSCIVMKFEQIEFL